MKKTNLSISAKRAIFEFTSKHKKVKTRYSTLKVAEIHCDASAPYGIFEALIIGSCKGVVCHKASLHLHVIKGTITVKKDIGGMRHVSRLKDSHTRGSVAESISIHAGESFQLSTSGKPALAVIISDSAWDVRQLKQTILFAKSRS